MTTTAALSQTNSGKPYIPLDRGCWRVPLFYMLSLSLVGLNFLPAMAFVLLFLAYEWRNDRYEFLIMLTIFCGGFGMIHMTSFPLWPSDIAILISAVAAVLLRKAPILKRLFTLVIVYLACIFVFALLSVESMKIQIFIMRRYWMVLYVFVPFALFAGRRFDIDTFLRKAFPYMMIIGIFYILDAYIINGHILVPAESEQNDSSIFSPAIHLLSGKIYRIYPPGLYFYALLFIPLLQTYRLKIWQWAVILGSLAACQTFTIIIAFVVVYIIFHSTVKQKIMWGLISVVALVGLYFIDGFLPEQKTEFDVYQSRLRIKSSVDQFFDLTEAFDDEDIAQFASGRMGQAIPKLDLVAREGRQLIGLGFLHPAKTTLNQYIIINEYYSDISKNEEVSTDVEISQIQVYINMGWLGLILVTAFYFYLYWSVRRLPYGNYVLSVLILNFMWGFGGYAGIYTPDGTMTIVVAYAAVVLNAREQLPGFRCPWVKQEE